MGKEVDLECDRFSYDEMGGGEMGGGLSENGIWG